MNDRAVKREQQWNSEWSAMQKNVDEQLRRKADEFARLDKWYHDELAAEKERARAEAADMRARQADELAKRDRAFKE